LVGDAVEPRTDEHEVPQEHVHATLS
jgi:hypothetical protein